MHWRKRSLSWPSPSSTILRVEDDINNNQPPHNGPDQRAHNGPADGLNQKVKIYHLIIASYITIKLLQNTNLDFQ